MVLAMAAPVLWGADPGLVRLERQIAAVSKVTDATVGAAAIHIESGRAVSFRGGEAFPMASAFKVPVAVGTLALVDQNTLAMDKMVTLGPADLHPGSGRITDLFFHPGVSLSLYNLMEAMLVISDNTAADLVLREGGGPAEVTARIRALGLKGIRVDRSTAQLISDFQGVKALPPEKDWTRDIWDRLYNAVPENEHMAARRAGWRDPRDTATPDDMAALMVKVWKHDGLSAESAKMLLEMMDRCETGKSRIKGLLPQGAEVAHKTGSLGGVVNDVGVLTLPGDAGHVALAVFTKGSYRPEEVSERAIAEVARTVYDYFTFVRE